MTFVDNFAGQVIKFNMKRTLRSLFFIGFSKYSSYKQDILTIHITKCIVKLSSIPQYLKTKDFLPVMIYGAETTMVDTLDTASPPGQSHSANYGTSCTRKFI